MDKYGGSDRVRKVIKKTSNKTIIAIPCKQLGIRGVIINSFMTPRQNMTSFIEIYRVEIRGIY